jgi:predicted metalloprotease with PDZ domain
MNYKISYHKPNSQYIPIEAEIEVKGKKSIDICLPAWRPGRYELGNFAKNIHGFSVFDDKGKKIAFQKTTKDVWNVALNKQTKIKVRYSYFAADLNAGSTFMNDQQLYVNPVNCLIYVKDQIDDACELKLELPANFTLACGASTQKKCHRH